MFTWQGIGWSAFSTFNKSHEYWRLIKKGTLYANPEHLPALAAGHGLASLFGGLAPVSITSKQIHAIASVISLVKQNERVFIATRNLKNSFYGKEILLLKIKPLGSSTLTLALFAGRKHVIYTSCLMIRTAHLTYEVFALSMTVLDLKEAFISGKESDFEKVTLLFVNLEQLKNDLADNREKILYLLEKNKKIIDFALQKSFAPINAKSLISTTDTLLINLAPKKGKETVAIVTTNYFAEAYKDAKDFLAWMGMNVLK